MSRSGVVLCGDLSARHLTEGPSRPPPCAQTAPAPEETETLPCFDSFFPFSLKLTFQTAGPDGQMTGTVVGGPCVRDAEGQLLLSRRSVKV